jgi:ubiquinone/menaquinone biosynthesis C-methylase UbiE
MSEVDQMSYQSVTNPAEQFLADFHRDHTGITTATMAHGHAPDGRSSYQVLADLADGHHRVLDLACGDGTLLDLLAGRPHGTLAGVDLSESELAAAARRPGLRDMALAQGRAQELPFRSAAFDACVSHMAFMLMSEPELVAAEIARVLAPGGLLAVAVSGGFPPGDSRDLFRTVLRRALADVPEDRQIPRFGDRRMRSADGIAEVLRPAGFGPVTWETLPIDLSGTLDEVWAVVSAVYDVYALNEDEVTGLRSEFAAAVEGIADRDGRITCTALVNVATTRLA